MFLQPKYDRDLTSYVAIEIATRRHVIDHSNVANYKFTLPFYYGMTIPTQIVGQTNDRQQQYVKQGLDIP